MTPRGTNPTPPLLDLLGAAWALDAPVTGVAWDGATAGFALGDGSLATARAEWDGAPKLRPREGGGLELAPGTAPRPPVGRQRVHDGACLSLAADPQGGFLSGGDDGTVARTGPDGTVREVGRYPGQWVDPVAASSAGWRAWAVGRWVHLSGPETAELTAPGSVTALAFDPAGTRLAVAHYRGVTLWQAGAAGPPRVLPTPGCPRSVAWSPDGEYVICGLQENALHGWRLSDGGGIEMGGYPGQPRSLAFSADGAIIERVRQSPRGMGFDARTGAFTDLVEAGVIDPVRVTATALRNAASVAGLILTTQILIATKPDGADPTAGPAMGGGAELL